MHMANNNIQDPNNVPGAEGYLPAKNDGFRDDPPREDPAGVGADRDGSDEAEGADPLHPEQRKETINSAEHGPEDRLAGARATLPVDPAEDADPPDPDPDPNDIDAQSAKRTDQTDADQTSPPDEPANPEAHEGL
jgi:hypothetical protein